MSWMVIADCETDECSGYKSRTLNMYGIGSKQRVIRMVRREDAENIKVHNKCHGRYTNYRVVFK